MSSSTVALIYAHPYAERSLANRELLAALDDLTFIDRRPIYDLYPDFDIDVEAERRRLEAVDLIVLQHPVYWYSMPSLLKLWIDEVFAHGWAYGEGGTALVGKHLQWVVTTGADFRAYSAEGPHGHPFEVFAAPMRQTAIFCGMQWQEPIVIHDAHADQAQVRAAGRRYRERLVAFDEQHPHRVERHARRHAASEAASAAPLAATVLT
jgi:glutathione-regulated potassium-efflux system ancillary protein KefF